MSDPRLALQKAIHELPASWTWEWFTDVLDIRGGTQPPASEFIDAPRSGCVRLVQIRDFESDNHITYIPDSPKWRTCSKNDVLIARYGASLGRICSGLEGAYNVALAKVVPSPRVDLGFVYYLLQSRYFQVPLLASGDRSAQAGFNKGGLSVIPLPVPPLPEQRAITEILGTLDKKIELNRRMNETMEEMARGIFKSWFVDFDPVRAKAEGRQPPGMSAEIAGLFPDSFEESELGEIPAGWEVAPLSVAFAVNPRRKIKKGIEATFLDMKSTPRSGHCPSHVYPRAFTSGMKFINGDTLLARITPCLENGKTAFVDWLENEETGWGSTEFIVLRPHPPLPMVFAYLLARDQGFRSFAIQSMTGSSGRQRVQVDRLGDYSVCVPTVEVGHAFGALMDPQFRRIRANQDENIILAGLRDTLLPKLLSGEIRVPEAEAAMEQTA